MLTSTNVGKIFTRTYERDKNAGEWDSSQLSAYEIEYLDIKDGEGKAKAKGQALQELTHGTL